MTRAFVSVGSNVDPDRNVPRALALLARALHVRAVSTFYRTEPEGRPGDPLFYNGVVECETDEDPTRLKAVILRGIEDVLGRERGPDRDAPRTMDLDLIVYGDRVLHDDGLVVPDPDILRRPFLALPLRELAPDLVLPGWGVAVRDVAARFRDADMETLPELTAALRRAVVAP